MLAPDDLIQHRLDGHNTPLSVLEVRPPGAGVRTASAGPCIIMLHGLRDTAWSLLPVARALAAPAPTHPGFRVILPELRGHGRSGRSDAYAMPHFLLDLHQVVDTFSNAACGLFGHSLGGHIISRYAALFPERVTAMLVVEGLGPPRRPHEGNVAAELRAYRDMLLQRLGGATPRGRPVADEADATARLLRNNPRLSVELARDITPHLLERRDGELTWAFDSRASSVFLGSASGENERFWSQVQAPTCIISGRLSFEYWGREMPAEGFTGRFAEGEMETRARLFKHHEHHWFEQSGHMVHYDEPEHLGAVSRQFLEQHYV